MRPLDRYTGITFPGWGTPVPIVGHWVSSHFWSRVLRRLVPTREDAPVVAVEKDLFPRSMNCDWEFGWIDRVVALRCLAGGRPVVASGIPTGLCSRSGEIRQFPSLSIRGSWVSGLLRSPGHAASPIRSDIAGAATRTALATTQERALIFGCGAAGRAVLPQVAAVSSVVGFVDNDAALHHGTVMGHTVFPPASLPSLMFDHVYIASMHHADIRRQLTADLGVSDARITVVAPGNVIADASVGSPLPENKLTTYLDDGFHAISGWLYMPAVEATLLLAEIQSAMMAPGPVCEIGVWEGRYLTLLSFVPSTPRRVLGIDPFIHASGTAEASADARRAQIGRVRANIARYARRPALVSLLEADSRRVGPGEIIERLGGRCQFVSVDGDHTAEGCLHDLQLAEGITLRGGVVSVDDIPNMTCPGVIEGVMRHCMAPGSTLAPFLSVANKLFLTHKELCETYREAILQRSREGRAGAWGESTLAYHERMQSMQVPVRFLGQDLLVCP